MLIGSLFSGAGLLDAGLAQAGHEHAWFVESDEWRRGHLARRWPDAAVRDDVRTAGRTNLCPVDCIAGGWPCKGNSTAGRRNGLAHPETALWAEFARIVGELRPAFVAVENVANVLAIHDGAVWRTVLWDLASLGYDVAWTCVRASDFGAPHQRDRVIAIAAHASRHGEGGPGAASGTDGERAWAGADVAPDASLVGHERGRRARPGRDGLADGGQAAADAANGGRAAAADAGEPRGLGRHARAGVAVEWGDYEPAIRRWEAVHGPAPEPLVRRLDDGDAKLRRVRARVDRSRLSALGDGVHVYLGRLIGEALHELDREGREVAPDA